MLITKKTQPPKGYYEEFIESGYTCPNCLKEPSEEPYFNDGKRPEYFNCGSSHSDLGSFHYYEEFHKCTNCNTKFWFQSGN